MRKAVLWLFIFGFGVALGHQLTEMVAKSNEKLLTESSIFLNGEAPDMQELPTQGQDFTLFGEPQKSIVK